MKWSSKDTTDNSTLIYIFSFFSVKYTDASNVLFFVRMTIHWIALYISFLNILFYYFEKSQNLYPFYFVFQSRIGKLIFLIKIYIIFIIQFTEVPFWALMTRLPYYNCHVKSRFCDVWLSDHKFCKSYWTSDTPSHLSEAEIFLGQCSSSMEHTWGYRPKIFDSPTIIFVTLGIINLCFLWNSSIKDISFIWLLVIYLTDRIAFTKYLFAHLFFVFFRPLSLKIPFI